jgi:hypothetical protein
MRWIMGVVTGAVLGSIALSARRSTVTARPLCCWARTVEADTVTVYQICTERPIKTNHPAPGE